MGYGADLLRAGSSGLAAKPWPEERARGLSAAAPPARGVGHA